MGAEKPDPAIFRVALDALRATPETTVLVGDSLRRDREGARRTGMRFIWMAPQGAAAAQAQSKAQVSEALVSAEPPVAHAVAEHVVTDLRDLTKLLP